jgi:hypothetical protein
VRRPEFIERRGFKNVIFFRMCVERRKRWFFEVGKEDGVCSNLITLV